MQSVCGCAYKFPPCCGVKMSHKVRSPEQQSVRNPEEFPVEVEHHVNVTEKGQL